jgi:hypothetical protein
MFKRVRTKLVAPKTKEHENQALETLERLVHRNKKKLVLSELDIEIECPRCTGFMELQSSFEKLVYSCEV